MQSHEFISHSEADTQRLGRALADALSPGLVVALNGPLGAGKTRLVQAIAAALGVPRDAVTSPTFVLIHEYGQGRLPVYHFDAYRIPSLDEFQELGPEEYFQAGGVTLIEWADRVAECLPAERLEIAIEVQGESGRRFVLTGRGEAARQVLAHTSAWRADA